MGLRIWVTATTEDRRILLTGEAVHLLLNINNLTSQQKKGRFAISWTIAGQQTLPQSVDFDLPPNGYYSKEFESLRPTRDGHAELRLHLYTKNGTLESNMQGTQEEFCRHAIGSDTSTLYSISVRDKGEFDNEQEWKRNQKSINIVLAVLSAVSICIGVISLLLVILK